MAQSGDFGSALLPAVLILAGTGIICMFYFLLGGDSYVFRPVPVSKEEVRRTKLENPRAEEIYVTSPDGVSLHGWFLRDEGEGRRPLIIYYGGNSEEVSHMLSSAWRFEGWSILLMNYRGYGLSGGGPSEKHLLEDAVFIYDVFTKRDDVKAGEVVAMGRSLGSGVAVHLASVRPLRGVILVSPYDSLTSVAEDLYPRLPVKFFLGRSFESLSKAQKAASPMLAVIASEDEIITPPHSMRLMEKWGGEKHLAEITGAGHNTLGLYDEYWSAIKRFLSGLQAEGTEAD